MSEKTFSQASRELKLKFQEQKNDVSHEYDIKQTELNIQIEKLRNERSYYIAKLRMGDDLEHSRLRIDELTADIAYLHRAKLERDRERKDALNALKRRHYEEINALEAKYSVELDEQGKEVVAV